MFNCIRFTCLFDRVTEKGRVGEEGRERSSLHSFALQIAGASWAAPGLSQEPGTPPRCPVWPKGLSAWAIFLAFLGPLAENWVPSAESGLKRVILASWGQFTHSATAPAPPVLSTISSYDLKCLICDPSALDSIILLSS